MKRRILTSIGLLVGVLAAAIVPVAVSVTAQITPGPVDYGPTITTNEEKLFACYALLEQMRVEHNRQGDIAAADPAKYIDTGKWQQYVMEYYRPVVKALLMERNALKTAIRRGVYSDAAWAKLVETNDEGEAVGAAEIALWGNKTAEEVKPTLAAADSLDELKLVELAKLPGTSGFDPTEDLTTYTEVDPNSHITVTSDRVTVDGIHRGEDAYLYYDKGSNHFDGDFEHLFQTLIEDDCNAGTPRWHQWLLGNDIDDVFGQCVSNTGTIYFYYRYYYVTTGHDFRIAEDTTAGDALQEDGLSGLSFDTMYYVTMARDEGVRTYGTLYAYVYSNTARTSQISGSPLSLTLREKCDFQYIYRQHL